MQAAFNRPEGTVLMVAGGVIEPGQVVQLPDGRAGVYAGATACAVGDLVTIFTKGIFDIAAASATVFSVGDIAVMDASAGLAITTPGTEEDFVLGRVVAAKVDGALVVSVEINTDGGAQLTLGVSALRAVNLDHADATEHVVLDASQNVTGMAVPVLRGRVTEVMVGSSQDQLKVALYDEDDNKLGELTATDGAADAVGDILFSGTCKNIPAGKAAYVKVSQATSGGTPAGAISIQAFVTPLVA